MSENKSYEQSVEHITRQIIEQRGRLLEDFFNAYAANLARLGKEFSIDDICLIEQEPHTLEGGIARKYWFEFKPNFRMQIIIDDRLDIPEPPNEKKCPNCGYFLMDIISWD
jgi:hypothetical protein